MELQRLQVTIDKEEHRYLGTTLNIKVVRSYDPSNNLHVQRIVPDNDFESYWDYVWNQCKDILDAEIKKDSSAGE